MEGLEQALRTEFASAQPLREWLREDDALAEEGLREKVLKQVEAEYQAKERVWQDHGVDMRGVEKQIMLQVLDQRWKEHLASMDYLRQSIHLRAYAQKQPKQEYKRESFELFQALLHNIKLDVVKLLSRVQIETPSALQEAERRRRAEAAKRMRFSHQAASALEAPAKPKANGEAGASAEAMPPAKAAPFVRNERKVGRNEPCPCGSGRKYKQCCGKVA